MTQMTSDRAKNQIEQNPLVLVALATLVSGLVAGITLGLMTSRSSRRALSAR